MSISPTYEVSKRRQLLAGVATTAAVAAVVATTWDGGNAVVATGVVLVAAAASSLASPNLKIAASNFVVGAGVFGTIAILVANEGMPAADGRVLLAISVAIPLAALLGSVVFTAARLEKDPALEFERHTVVRAASAAFATVTLVALALTIVDVVSAEPAPPPVVFLFVATFGFVVALMTERRRMSR